MQSGLDRLVAGARQAGIYRCCGRLCVLVLGLMVSACANVGQIGNLGIGQILSSPDSPQQMSIAVESIDGPPTAVHEKFLRALKEEAGGRRITVVTSGEADYHLRGYLASHAESDATSITWVWDVYDAGQQRAFRLSGKDKAGAGAGWATADDQVLRRIARSGLDQLAVLAAAPRKQTAAATPAPQPERKSTSTFAWLDDWAPETAGIFRIIRGEDARAEPAATAGQPQVAEIPLPRSRPSPEEGPARTFASLEAR